MNANDLRKKQREKLLKEKANKPTVTLSQQKSLEASKASIQLISLSYNEPMLPA